MISTGSIGTGTGPYKSDIVKKDLKARRLKGKAVNARHVLNEVKQALKQYLDDHADDYDDEEDEDDYDDYDDEDEDDDY